jgi:hypothetical protein
MQTSDIWNLQDIIRELAAHCPEIEEIYLFGSRAYKTGSRRSDIDILLYSPIPIAASILLPWVHTKYPPLDIFLTTDKLSVQSIINGSARYDANSIIKRLDAILLWDKNAGFSSSFNAWKQETDSETRFLPTMLPIRHSFGELVRNFASTVEEHGYPNTFLGGDWSEIGDKLCDIIDNSLEALSQLTPRAPNIKEETLRLQDEYDFQNLIYISLKPWLSSLEREAVTIRYVGQEKRADFSLVDSSLIIEAKHIRDTNTESQVTKTLEGLAQFYKQNTNVKLLLFLILTEPGVIKDIAKIQHDFSGDTKQPVIIVRIFNNPTKTTTTTVKKKRKNSSTPA